MFSLSPVDESKHSPQFWMFIIYLDFCWKTEDIVPFVSLSFREIRWFKAMFFFEIHWIESNSVTSHDEQHPSSLKTWRIGRVSRWHNHLIVKRWQKELLIQFPTQSKGNRLRLVWCDACKSQENQRVSNDRRNSLVILLKGASTEIQRNAFNLTNALKWFAWWRTEHRGHVGESLQKQFRWAHDLRWRFEMGIQPQGLARLINDTQ
jgi:hypothetical protein